MPDGSRILSGAGLPLSDVRSWNPVRISTRSSRGFGGISTGIFTLALDGRKWVHGRTHLELGKLAAKSGNRAVARTEFQTAISLCESDNDPGAAEEARRLAKQVG